MRLQEIERIPAKDFTGRDTLNPQLQYRSELKGLKQLSPRFYYRINDYGGQSETLIQQYYEVQPGLVRQVGELETSRAWEMPIPAQRVSYIAVDPRYRKLGLALQLYRLYLDKTGLALVAGDSQTPGGRAMWQRLWQDPQIDVVGLVGVEDSDFDRWEELPQFRQWIDNLMAIGGEYLGQKTFHWFEVPLRQMRREMNILRGFRLYDPTDWDTDEPVLATTMLARRRGAQ